MTHVRSMRDLFEEHQAYALAGQALPTPTDTPYSRSRVSSHHGTPPLSDLSSSPPPFPPDFEKENTPITNEDELSLLDPRRITPTLHASLVSEILSLRRELESKDRFIDGLEHNLHTSRSENESLQEQLAETNKENRSAKRQLKQVEDGTMAALQELASERDDLKTAQKDLRNKLELSQKDVKTQAQDVELAHNLYASEKLKWENEKRTLERKVHVSESRLKTFIDEVNAQHAAEFPRQDETSDNEEDARDSGLGNDSDVTSAHSSPTRQKHTRGRSADSIGRSSTRQSNRYSMESGFVSGRQSRQQGVSLADELVFDEEDEDLDDLEEIEDEYADHETRLRRARESRQSFNQDDKAKRVLGLSSGRDSSFDQRDSLECERRDIIQPIQEVPTPKEDGQSPIEPSKPLYVDTGIQYSPPMSPMLPIIPQTLPPLPLEAGSILSEKSPQTPEVEANQSRKRIASPTRSPSTRPLMLAFEKPITSAITLMSTATQTMEEPETVKPAFADVAVQSELLEAEVPLQPSYSSMSTQTDDTAVEPANKRQTGRALAPASLIIPSIAIHPPLSGPPSPKEAVLPPATRNAACQVALEKPCHTVDSGTQTDRITIDQRLLKLPPHLWPSAIKNKDANLENAPSTVKAGLSSTLVRQKSGNESKAPLQSFPRSAENRPSSVVTEDRYPGDNDNGPVSEGDNQVPRRPFRSASLFAGFNEEEGGDDTDLDEPASHIKTRTAPKSTSASRLARNGFSFSDPPTPVPEEKESPHSGDAREDDLEETTSKPEPEGTVAESSMSARSSFERATRISKPSRMSSMAKPLNLRRSSLIANGTAMHLRQGSRTPSEASFGSASMSSSMAPPPPFPVPLRSSSRRVWQTRSEGSYSPTPGQNGMHSGRRTQADVGKHPGKDALRKVRSANVIPRRGGKSTRPRSRSPPSSFQSSMPSPTLAEHEIPEMPRDNIKSPRHVFELQKSNHKGARSDITSQTGSASAESSSQQQSTVVEAIAIAMVGEWMWKYVRRRKSFGVPESPSEVSKPGEDGSITVTSNGQRHKRWVWLSPYERAVMWSGKQPSSNSALMGKSGRKLIIQSVLDVKDDTPLPKNSGQIFNRSILILTPARALKFTAITSDRHYLWLTALSFLAHHPSQRLSPLPAIPVPEPKSIKSPLASEVSPIEPRIPIPEKEPEKPSRATATLRRTPLRDSVRVAKDRAGVSSHRRPGAPLRNATAPPTLPENRESSDRATYGATGSGFFDKLHADPPPAQYRFADFSPPDDRLRPGTAGTTATTDSAAEYPTIPRYYGHGRKRSTSLSGAVMPSLADLPNTMTTTSTSGRLGSLRGWSSTATRPMSRDASIPDPPLRTFADLNESTTTIAPPPIPVHRTRSGTSEPRAAPSTASSRNGTMRMEAFVETHAAAATGKSRDAMGWPERMRTGAGRRLPGLGVRRRSRVPDAWTKGVVVGSGEGGEGEGGLVDPFRGF